MAATAPEAPVRTELAIGGMTCAACSAHVGRALRKVPGVREATVNLATERAEVLHAPDVADALLIGAVERAGYSALPVVADAPASSAEPRAARARRARLIVAVALGVPALVLGMLVPEFGGKDLLMLALVLPVWGYVGWEFHRGALARLRGGGANMDTLVSLGSTAALGSSIAASMAHAPASYETASSIVALIFAGKYLEAAARGRSGDALRALLALRPQDAQLRDTGGAVRRVPVESVRRGDHVVVAPGERVPVDGVIVEGESAVDVSLLTGEPIPVDVEPGCELRAGTLNGDGLLVVRATAVGAGTALARIVEIVRRAQGSVPPVQRLADRAAGVFVPAIVAIAAATFGGRLLAGTSPGHALAIAVAVLVVACPCALGLATPVAIVVGIGAGAKRGLLFRDAAALERVGSVDVVLFDKTGTLTFGRPDVTAVHRAPTAGAALGAGSDPGPLIALAAAVERGSTHPLAAAIVRAAEQRGLAIPAAIGHAAERGRGVRAIVAGRTVLAGTGAYLRSAGVPLDPAFESVAAGGATVVYVAADGRLAGALELADAPRPRAREAVAALHALRVRCEIVSGDLPGPVAAVAAATGADAFRAQQSPEDKAAFVVALQAEGRRVAFAGDGINDAPALASADVGLAMGAGTEIALEAAGAAILSDDPMAIVDAVRLSRATARTIRENLFWAFAYNALLVPLAAAGIVRPVLAAAAMGLSSLFVLGNALRLRRSLR